MRSSLGHRSTDLRVQVLEAPWRFEAFQAVRIIERALVAAGAPSSCSRWWPVRLTTSTSLAFAPSDIETLHVKVNGEPRNTVESSIAALGSPGARVHIVQPATGLLGVSGGLPVDCTERLAGSEGQRRHPAAKAFLDMLSHRAIAAWYRAWKYRHPALHSETDDEGGMIDILRAMAGAGLESQRRLLASDDVQDRSIAMAAPAVRSLAMSAAYLARVLAAQFDCPVQVREFVGSWHPLPDTARFVLGEKHCSLGVDTTLGARQWQQHHRIQIRLGPLPLDAWAGFLPGETDARSLAAWLRLLLRSDFEMEVVPILGAGDVAPMVLGRRGRLGRDAFLAPPPNARDRDDARYLIDSQ